jgi:hypothetical protein
LSGSGGTAAVLGGTDGALAAIPSTRLVVVHAVWPRASRRRGYVSASALPLCLSLGRAERHHGNTTVSAMLVLAVTGKAWWRRQGVNSTVRMRLTMPFVTLSVRAPARVLGESSAQPKARSATRDAIGRSLLLEGVVEEPLADSWPIAVIQRTRLGRKPRQATAWLTMITLLRRSPPWRHR